MSRFAGVLLAWLLVAPGPVAAENGTPASIPAVFHVHSTLSTGVMGLD